MAYIWVIIRKTLILENVCTLKIRLLMSPLATVAQKSFNGKFTAKIDFPIRHIVHTRG